MYPHPAISARCQRTKRNFRPRSAEGTALMPDKVIVELKFRRATPPRFKYLVGEFLLNAPAFSKYRLAAAQLGLVREPALVARTEATPVYA